MLKRFIATVFTGCLLIFSAVSLAEEQEQPVFESILLKMVEILPKSFHAHLPELTQQLSSAWEQLVETGAFTQKFESDQTGRDIIVNLQAVIERTMVEEHQDCSNMFWIIHAPTIATPLVTIGDNTPLSRPDILKQFLKRGGSIMVVYQADRRVGEQGRTPEQIAVFESLQAQYPTQLIEFPVDPSVLPNGEFPKDLIGATYWIQETPSQLFEMSLHATQASQPCEDCEWGFWLSSSESPNEAASERLALVYDFLSSVGYNPEEDLMD